MERVNTDFQQGDGARQPGDGSTRIRPVRVQNPRAGTRGCGIRRKSAGGSRVTSGSVRASPYAELPHLEGRVTFPVTYLKSLSLRCWNANYLKQWEKGPDGLGRSVDSRGLPMRKTIDDNCATNGCAPTMKRVTYVTIKRHTRSRGSSLQSSSGGGFGPGAARKHSYGPVFL